MFVSVEYVTYIVKNSYDTYASPTRCKWKYKPSLTDGKQLYNM